MSWLGARGKGKAGEALEGIGSCPWTAFVNNLLLRRHRDREARTAIFELTVRCHASCRGSSETLGFDREQLVIALELVTKLRCLRGFRACVVPVCVRFLERRVLLPGAVNGVTTNFHLYNFQHCGVVLLSIQ